MALKLELIADEARGPGYGLLRVAGCVVSGSIRLCVRGNQAGYGYLAAEGHWQAQEFWHELPPPRSEGLPAVIELGPDLMDPIATLPANVALQMNLGWDGRGDTGPVKLVRPLYPSSAAGPGPYRFPDSLRHDPVASRVAQPDPEPVVEMPSTVAPPPVPGQVASPVAERTSSRGWVIPFVAATLLAALGLGVAYYVGLPPFEKALVSQPTSLPVPPAEPAPDSPRDIGSLADVKRYLQTNPAPEAASATARQLAERGKSDLALLVHQHAARAGYTDSHLAVARMYDPDTWSAQSSPLPQPDAETAGYWYEPAARAGSLEAQRQLGKILVALHPSGFQREKGKEWLGKAAAAGDAAARALLDTTK